MQRYSIINSNWPELFVFLTKKGGRLKKQATLASRILGIYSTLKESPSLITG